jgi:hypothetical protein
MTIEITATSMAAKAAQWLAEAQTTIGLARAMPELPTLIQRLLRTQSLGTCLGAMDATARFFYGPLTAGLRPYVIDWQASDDECRKGEGVEDFCAELRGLSRPVEEALAQWEESHDCAPQPRGLIGSNAP